jgi:RND family efflux transporter MFP subunit
MTRREKYLIAAGIVLGLLVAGLIAGGFRILRPERGIASVEGSAPTADEPRSAQRDSQHEQHDQGGRTNAESPSPAARVQLTEDEQRSIGVQTTVVRHREIQRQLLAVARVEQAETQLANISARVGGRIDKLRLDYTGQAVGRGQALAEIYSPEVLSSAEEYRLALENRKRLASSAETEAVSGADALVTASRRRLELWGLTAAQINAIASSEKPQLDLTIYSPASGIVIERKVTQGQYVNAGDVLYTISDLNTVWVKADIYQGDLGRVRVGQAVEISSDSVPGAKLQGHVGLIEPMVDAQTRTTAARIQVSNRGMRLRPGMFVNARFATRGEHTLAIPRSAVVDTGTRKLVYVVKGKDMFEAHEVELGAGGEDYYPVMRGLQEGDRIVTQGNFLLDSQTRISGGMTGMFGGSKEFNGQEAVPGTAQWKVSLRTDPEKPQGGSQAAVVVSVQDARAEPVRDAKVDVTLFMPAMPAMGMGEMREAATLAWRGSEYAGAIKVPTAGTWTVTVNVSREAQLLTSYRTSLNAR